MDNVTINLGTLLTVITALGTGAAGWWVRGTEVRKYVKRMGFFFDDWAGTPERPGVTSRPGVMERLAKIEAAQEETRAQLLTNGGSTLRDEIRAITPRLHVVESQLAALTLTAVGTSPNGYVAGPSATLAAQDGTQG